ncbi:aldolase/citrate lyase family protein [Shinella sp. S4-D37]|uniref:HpcH/HpaI aldolase family protein n=1 Tax=Shinella sp. S4-D37 TaxID=3161999 RepID=UPI00346749A9
MTKNMNVEPTSAMRIGTWISLHHPAMVEIIALAGFDFLLIDGEHGQVLPHALHELAPAVEAAGSSIVYRVPANRPEYIKAGLDQGAWAVMVPMVESVTQARAAVDAAKYAPLGRRGIGPLRASRYYAQFGSYLEQANRRTELIVQIESRDGLSSMREIAAIDGVDLLYVGPTDLADSLGEPLGSMSATMLSAFSDVARAAQQAGKVAGIDCADPSLIETFSTMGFSFFSVGGDAQYLLEGANATRVAALRYAGINRCADGGTA